MGRSIQLHTTVAGFIGAWVALLILAGCGFDQKHADNGLAKSAPYSDQLQVGEMVSVVFSGISDPPPRHDEQIQQDGSITLPLVGSIKAIGKTPGQLQQEIWQLYVPRFYQRLTVTVGSESRFFFVSGQVHAANRYPYTGQMTVLKAIAAAGDFTDYANKKKIEVRRVNGQKIRVNAIKAQEHPELDPPIFPGDQVFVPRRVL